MGDTHPAVAVNPDMDEVKAMSYRIFRNEDKNEQ